MQVQLSTICGGARRIRPTPRGVAGRARPRRDRHVDRRRLRTGVLAVQLAPLFDDGDRHRPGTGDARRSAPARHGPTWTGLDRSPRRGPRHARPAGGTTGDLRPVPALDRPRAGARPGPRAARTRWCGGPDRAGHRARLTARARLPRRSRTTRSRRSSAGTPIGGATPTKHAYETSLDAHRSAVLSRLPPRPCRHRPRPDEVVSGYLSMSFAAPDRFGDRLDDFVTDLRALLAERSPTGLFHDWPGDTAGTGLPRAREHNPLPTGAASPSSAGHRVVGHPDRRPVPAVVAPQPVCCSAFARDPSAHPRVGDLVVDHPDVELSTIRHPNVQHPVAPNDQCSDVVAGTRRGISWANPCVPATGESSRLTANTSSMRTWRSASIGSYPVWTIGYHVTPSCCSVSFPQAG